jgi:hypothetical protein
MITAGTSALYYKHITIVNDKSGIINKFEASLTDGDRVIIYDHHMFIAQATGENGKKLNVSPGNTKGGSITIPLTSCLTGLESVV